MPNFELIKKRRVGKLFTKLFTKREKWKSKHAVHLSEIVVGPVNADSKATAAASHLDLVLLLQRLHCSMMGQTRDWNLNPGSPT